MKKTLRQSINGSLGLAAVLLFSLCLCAQQHSPSAPVPNSALEFALRVDRHYNQLHSLKAEFVESYEGLGMNRVERGTLLMMKPGHMRWNYSEPRGKLFILDGKYAWFYAEGDSEIQRISASKLDDLRSPLRFLLGHSQIEKELNNLTLTSTSNGAFILSGQPKGQEKRVARINLTVTASGTITKIEIEETDGALTSFTLTNEEPNAPVPAESFHYTPPAGIPVVDALPPV